MLNRKNFFALAFAAVLLPATVLAQQAPVAFTRQQGIGPENTQLAQRVGIWDVVETVGSDLKATPTVLKLVAERKMVGAFLQETIRPSLNSPQVLRIDYLSFHQGEGRWKYVSMDMRAPVGIMSAASFGTGKAGRIDLTFEPLTDPTSGQLLQMSQAVLLQDATHDRKEQYFVVADGKGTTSSHTYVYTRRTPDGAK